MDFWLVAQSSDGFNSLAGGAGWVGAGLLGCVLAWLLLKHLPSKDAQMKEFWDAKDRHVQMLTERNDVRLDKLVEAFEKESRDVRAEFKGALEAVLHHCEREAVRIAEAVRVEIKTLAPNNRQTPQGPTS